MGEKDLIFLGAMLLLSGNGYVNPDENYLQDAINTSKNVFNKVFDTEE